MSTLWNKWGEIEGQTTGHDGINYYIKSETGKVIVNPDEFDDLVYKFLETKRKVEGE